MLGDWQGTAARSSRGARGSGTIIATAEVAARLYKAQRVQKYRLEAILLGTERIIAIFLIAVSGVAIALAQNSAAKPPAAPQREDLVARARLLILGVVDHSGQLVSAANQPGMLSAFIDKLHPDAICIERPPDQTARRDFYEFTYEVLGIILPYVASHPTDVCPIDWMPPCHSNGLRSELGSRVVVHTESLQHC